MAGILAYLPNARHAGILLSKASVFKPHFVIIAGIMTLFYRQKNSAFYCRYALFI